MRAVVSDTGPLRYLVQIEHADILPQLFTQVVIPQTVAWELQHPSAPEVVREFIAKRPEWLEAADIPRRLDRSLDRLDPGERDAILQAHAVSAQLVLMDDRRAAAVARSSGLLVTGTLGILDTAARRGLLDIGEAITRLRATNFRCRPTMLDALLTQHGQQRS